MKKVLLLFFTLTLLGCSLDDEQNFALEIMSIESIDIPSEFTFGETYEISMTYLRPNSCYQFNDFIFESNGDTRTIAIVDTVYLNQNCTQEIEEATVSFNFSVTSLETYIFQFYQGEDDQGEDQYIITEVTVNQ